MTVHHLSSEFHYLGNRAKGVGYVVSRTGDRSIVNLDAMDLLTAADTSWQDDPDYQPFVRQAVAARWLVSTPPAVRPSIREIDRPAHLVRLQYEINLLCNLECAHCYCSSSPKAPPGLSTAFVLDLVRQAADLGVMFFDLTGGEPLIRPDLLEVVRSIRDHGMVPSLFTNCTLVTPELARDLKAAGISAVQTSLDAATPALHDAIRGKRGAFARALRGIRAFQAEGVPISVTVCLNRRNAHEIDAIVRLMRDELKVPFRTDRVIPAGRGLEQAEPLALPNHEYYALIHPYLAGSQAMAKKICDSPNLQVSARHIEPECGVGASYMFVKHDGRAALCPTMTEAESPDFAQADLTSMSLADAWERHPTFQRYRGMQCENATVCPSGSTCRGGCRSNAYILHGRVDAPDELSCNLHKNGTPSYRPFLEEYQARSDGRPARRRLPVLPSAA